MASTNINKLAKNYIYSSGFQLLSVIIPLIVTPYITRHLGASSLGVDTYVLSIVQVCQIFGSLGTTIYGNREIAYVRNDKERLARTFWEIFLLRLILCMVSVGIYLTIAVHTPYTRAFILQLGTLFAYFFDVSWLFIGLENVKPITLASAVIRTITTVSIFTFVKQSSDLYAYILIYATGQVAISMLLLLYGRWKIPMKFGKNLHVFRHIRPVIALFLPQAASSLYVLFDKVMLGSLASDISRISLYDKAEVIVKAPTVLSLALTNVLMPRMANHFKKGEMHVVKNIVREAVSMMMLLFLPISAGLVVIAPIFVPLYLGKEFQDSVYVVYILAPIIVAIGLSSVSGAQFLIACNETKWLTISYATSAVFNICGNFILIPKLNEIGASITTLMAECIVVLIQYHALRRRIGSIDIWKIVWKKIIATASMVFIIYPMYRLGRTVKIGILQILCGMIVYVLVLILLRDETFMRGAALVLNRRKKDE